METAETTLREVLAVPDAREEFAASHPRHAEFVELRFFGGFSATEAADILGVSRATLTRDWRFSRLWLLRLMAKSAADRADVSPGIDGR